ncbi:hypothetical protein D0T84_13995 [Dysgonomonas sp. 521]|nr:hypothetical protein [Dysgonomonas sp. 521]
MILENLKDDYEDMSDADKALFAMLYIQARDKKAEVIECDDRLEFSINYYTQTNQKNRLAHCYLYKARAFVQIRDYESTSRNLLNALELAKDGKDPSLLGKIYFDLGRISGFQDHFDDALDYYRKSVACFEQTGEVKNTAGIYTVMGNIHQYYERSDSAIYYNKLALSLTTDSIIQGDVLNNLGYIYYNMNMSDSSVYYLKQSLHYPFFDTNMSMRLYNLARTYYIMEETDSAEYYMHKASEEDMDIYYKEEIYRLAIGIAIQKGENELIPHYMNELAHIEDSIAILSRQTDIKTVEKIQVVNNHSEKVKSQRRILLAAAIVLFLIGLSVSYLLYKRFKLKKNAAEQYKAELEEKHERLEETSELLEKKQEQIKKTVEIQILEINQQLEKVSDKYAGARKKATLTQRELIKKEIFEEVLKFSNERVFIEKMNKTLNLLPEKLQYEFPDINYKEILWCCLFLLKIPTPDISLILGYTQSSLYKFKQRLGYKLGYTSMKDFEQMLYDKLSS